MHGDGTYYVAKSLQNFRTSVLKKIFKNELRYIQAIYNVCVMKPSYSNPKVVSLYRLNVF